MRSGHLSTFGTGTLLRQDSILVTHLPYSDDVLRPLDSDIAIVMGSHIGALARDLQPMYLENRDGE